MRHSAPSSGETAETGGTIHSSTQATTAVRGAHGSQSNLLFQRKVPSTLQRRLKRHRRNYSSARAVPQGACQFAPAPLVPARRSVRVGREPKSRRKMSQSQVRVTSVSGTAARSRRDLRTSKIVMDYNRNVRSKALTLRLDARGGQAWLHDR